MRAPFVLLLFPAVAVAYNILGVFPYPGGSHYAVFEPLMTNLAVKGHNVTVISHFPRKTPIENYEDVILDHPPASSREIFDMNNFKWWYRYLSIYRLHVWARLYCEQAFASPAMGDFLKANRSYDVLVVEMFNSDCMLGLAHVYGAPFVGISSSVLLPFHYGRIGNPSQPSYVGNALLDVPNSGSFAGRLQTLFANVVHGWFFENVINAWDDRVVRERLGEDVPPVREIAKECSLILANQHFSLTAPKPQVPALVDVGGIHLKENRPLVSNIEKWINESTHGVIYFSLGSMIKGHTFPEEKRQIFLRAFARLPQRVLWKWENDTMPGKPDNVMTQKWMPQFDILCHPNVRAFISHGGLLGTTEAVHCGVPAIVMPQFGDQYTNAKAWEANGGAVIMELGSVTDERLQEALQKVLDPKFREQAKELSARYRDRPMSPLDTAIYWVEYVARHKGAPFLRTAAVGMPFYKYLLLDVIAFLLLVLAVIVYVNYLFWRMILRKLFGKGQKVKTN